MCLVFGSQFGRLRLDGVFERTQFWLRRAFDGLHHRIQTLALQQFEQRHDLAPVHDADALLGGKLDRRSLVAKVAPRQNCDGHRKRRRDHQRLGLETDAAKQANARRPDAVVAEKLPEQPSMRGLGRGV